MNAQETQPNREERVNPAKDIYWRKKIMMFYFRNWFIYTALFAMGIAMVIHYAGDLSFTVIEDVVLNVSISTFTILFAVVGIVDLVFRDTFKRLRGTKTTKQFFSHLFGTIIAFGILIVFITAGKYVDRAEDIKNIILFATTLFCFVQCAASVYLLRELIFRELVRIKQIED